jgi:pyrroline-5-carboxylate reductase
MSRRVGLIGAGHLGRAIAHGLVGAGLPRRMVALCHGGSSHTRHALEVAGLDDRVVDARELADWAQVVLYLVRPQQRAMIDALVLRPDALFVSFLAGVTVGTLPVHPSQTPRVRVMTSTPDTLRAANAIAAAFPPNNPLVDQLLTTLGARVLELSSESDFHAFTALGPGLPVALTIWEGLGHDAGEADIVALAAEYGLGAWSEVVAWARSVQPRGLTAAQRDAYVAQATTPGGVLEAVGRALASGLSLTDSLRRGVARSNELSGS